MWFHWVTEIYSVIYTVSQIAESWSIIHTIMYFLRGEVEIESWYIVRASHKLEILQPQPLSGGLWHVFGCLTLCGLVHSCVKQYKLCFYNWVDHLWLCTPANMVTPKDLSQRGLIIPGQTQPHTIAKHNKVTCCHLIRSTETESDR